MTKKIINIGSSENAGNGDPLRVAFGKINDNFTELYNLTGVTSLTELAQDYAAGMFSGGTHSGITVTYDDANNKLNLAVSGSNKLVAESKEVVLTGGANPYVTFPTVASGENIIIQGAEIASSTGAVAITSSDSVVINTNALTALNTWTFGDDGNLELPPGFINSNQVTGLNLRSGYDVHIISNHMDVDHEWILDSYGDLTLPGGIKSEGAINIDINLSDSTLRRWTFGEDGSLTFPDTTVQTTAWLGAIDQLFNTGETFTLSSSGNVTFSGLAGGINRGLVWDYGAAAGGVNSRIRQDEDGLTVRAYTENGGDYAAPVRILTNQDGGEMVWSFGGTGDLTIPGNIILSDNDTEITVGVDKSLNIQTRQYTTLADLAATGSGTGIFVADISANDDITLVQAGWRFNAGSVIAPIWVTVASAVTVAGNTHTLGVPDVEFIPGEEYEFQNPTPANTGPWEFTSLGTLKGPGGSFISSETAIIDNTFVTYDLSSPSRFNKVYWNNNDTLYFSVATDTADPLFLVAMDLRAELQAFGVIASRTISFTTLDSTTHSITFPQYSNISAQLSITELGSVPGVTWIIQEGTWGINGAPTANTIIDITSLSFSEAGTYRDFSIEMSDSIDNVEHRWAFKNDATTVFPGSLEFGDGSVQTTAFTGSSNSIVNGSYTLSVASTGPVNIPTASTGLGRLQNASGIEILTNSGASAKLWAFGADGELTVPGNIVPSTDVAYDLGSPTHRFRDLYLSTNTLYLGSTSMGINAAGQLVLSEEVSGGGEGIGGIASVEWTTNNELLIRTTDTSSFADKFEILNVGDTFELLSGSNGPFPAQTIISVSDVVSKTDTGIGFFDFVIPVDFAPVSDVFVYTFILGKIPSNGGNVGELTFPDSSVQTTAYPGIINKHQGSATLVVGQNVATRGNLSIRLTNNNNTLDVEINYQNPTNTVKVSAYRMFPGPVNLGAGSYLRAPGNTIWDNVQNLSSEGDSVGFVLTDHSFHKIYRVTVIADVMPGVSAAGEAYCTIEELK